METRRQDRDILSHQFRGQQGEGTSTQREVRLLQRSVIVADRETGVTVAERGVCDCVREIERTLT